MQSRGPRGRARTRSDVAQTPIVPPPGAATAGAPAAAPPSQAAGPEGRGRGLAGVSEPEQTTSPSQHSPTESGISPTESSPPKSPPKAPVPLGRAAMRGKIAPTGTTSESVPVDVMAKMTLQEAGDVQETVQRPRYNIESVPYTRPSTCVDKKGTSGAAIRVMANFFEILSAPNWVLYQYHVDFSPQVESRRMRVALLHSHDHLFPKNKAFDGSTLYSLTKLPQEMTEVQSVRTTDNAVIMIKIKRVGEITPLSTNFVHLFNLVFRRCMQLYGMTEITRNFYDMSKPVPIPQFKLEMVNGYTTAIAAFENKLMLCAEVSHRLIHVETVYDIIADFYANDRENFQNASADRIVGQIVMTRYNNKTYRVDDIDWNFTPRSTFQTSDGRDISFMDYYDKHYNIKIRDIDQPLLISLPKDRDKRRGQNKPILLIPELCVLTGLSDSMRANNYMMRELAKNTEVRPEARYNRLCKFIENISRHDKVQTELSKWEMKFDQKPVEFSARRLEPETLIFGDEKKKRLDEKAEWTADMKSAKHITAIPLRDWVIFFSPYDENLAYSFVETMEKVTRSMGIRVEQPNLQKLANDRTESYVSAVKHSVTPNTQLAVFLLPTNKKDRYDAIKKYCCLDLPVPSQCILTKNLKDSKKVMGVMTKVAVQINCKLGGEIWGVSIPMKKVMLCGIDTYHDSQKKGRSVCAFVATLNQTYTRFYSRATLQETHQELADGLTLSVRAALQQYVKYNGELPDKIIIFRDGVSDGQLPLVTDYEIPQMISSFEMVNQGYSPKLACIIVKKRGNARFFEADNGNLRNPQCGTVIDNTVTRKEWFDYYLISQNVLQGTVNPTHYNVVYDTTGLKPDHFQKLSFKLTHMYYNWSGTIRVPALCQYAHKLAFLVGQSLHKEHNLMLADKLFYL